MMHPMSDEPGGAQPDRRNTLNDLTGREWTYAIRSVLATRYPTSGAAGFAHRLRRAHPSPKPPQLMAELIRFFTRRGGIVLDPFAGVGGTLLGCALEERRGIGIELSPQFIAIYHQVCQQLQLSPQTLVQGDARDPACYAALGDAPCDLILTDPPYAGMLARPRTGERKKHGQGAATPFSADPADLGNLDYAAFLPALRDVIQTAVARLRVRGYLVLFVKDLQPDAGHHNLLHADVVTHLMQIGGLRFRGYRIWHDESLNLYPFGYPYAFVAHQVHQFILVFRKEA